ncbi:MAG: hypothetical protein ACFB0B_03935 [Thermonemataceae bacterium]
MKKALQAILNTIRDIGEEARELIFEKLAVEELIDIEKQLNQRIPEAFR